MAHYSPEMLAAMRHAYENTDETLRLIAAEYKIGITTLQALRDKEGWTKRSERLRDCPPEMRLLQAAKALAAAPAHSPDLDRHPEAAALSAALEEPAPDLIRGRTPQDRGPPSFEAPPASAGVAPQDHGDVLALPAVNSPLSAIDRLEALVVKEIAAEEAVRDRLQGAPRRRADAERCARTLSTLAQTLRSLQQQRCGRVTDDETIDDDDMPADIDEFRHELARRIEAFVASRTGADAAESGGPAPIADASTNT